MTDDGPEISVVISTRDRPVALLTCLRSVRAAADRLPNGAVEIVVVESASRADLRLNVEDVQGLGARLILEPRGGLSRARNAGIAEAVAPVLFFTDDDCKLAEDAFEALRRHIAALDPPYLIGGRVLQGDPQDRPLTLRLETTAELYTPDRPPGGFVPGCNFALHRRTLEEVGDFDESLGAGTVLRSGEDTDFTIRCHLAGIPVRYEPDIVVHHSHGRRTQEVVREVSLAYSIGNGALYLRYWRHPWLWRHFLWVVRDAARERFGGRGFDPANGLTWRDVLRGNLKGMVMQARSGLGGPSRHPGPKRAESGGRRWTRRLDWTQDHPRQ